MKKLRKFLTVFMVMLLLSTMLSACSESGYEEESGYAAPENPDTSSGVSSTVLSVDKETGELTVQRHGRSGNLDDFCLSLRFRP